MTKAPALAPMDFPAALASVADSLRRIIFDSVPGVEERVYSGRTSAGYHDRHAGAFCGLFSSRDVVRLEFPRGVWTPRPERILVGGRYVQFRAGERIPRAAIKRILHGALLARL